MISANLIGKCLLIGGAGAATGTGIYFIQKSYFSYNKELKELAEKVGLICEGNPTETSGVECTKKEGADVRVKQGDSNNTFDAKTISGGKIKVYLKSKDEEYNKDFKFVIEDGDISTSVNDKKLEQFETYEIKEDPKETWKLNRKSEAKTEIKKALGLPEGTSCNFPTSTTEVDCTLTVDQLKKVKFEGLVDKEVNINSGTPKLKISKVGGSDYGTAGYKFVLESAQDTNFSNSLIIKKNTNTEFKIKKENGSLTLEKAWTVKSLGEKVGLNCPETVTKGAGECTLGESINVNNNGASETNKKHAGLTKKEDAEGKKKVKFELDKEGHSQGFKFFTEESGGIGLKDGASVTAGTDTDSKKIEPKGSNATHVTYEIKKDTDNKWYLTKKTTTESQ